MTAVNDILCSAFPRAPPANTQQQYHKIHAWIANNVAWRPGSTVNIVFTPGSKPQYMADFQKLIETHYGPIVNLNFTWDQNGSADITVGFNKHMVLQSAIGADSRLVTIPNMTIGNKTVKICDNCSLTVPDVVMDNLIRYQGKVLHEFGHALGMMHEMQKPVAKGNFEFIESKVIENFVNQGALAPPVNSQANKDWYKMNFQPMTSYGSSATGNNSYDQKSIMTYAFGPETNTAGVRVTEPNKLSDIDVEWLQKTYPGKQPEPSEPQTTVDESTPTTEISTPTTEISTPTTEIATQTTEISTATQLNTTPVIPIDISTSLPFDEGNPYEKEWQLWLAFSLLAILAAVGLFIWLIVRVFHQHPKKRKQKTGTIPSPKRTSSLVF